MHYCVAPPSVTVFETVATTPVKSFPAATRLRLPPRAVLLFRVLSERKDEIVLRRPLVISLLFYRYFINPLSIFWAEIVHWAPSQSRLFSAAKVVLMMYTLRDRTVDVTCVFGTGIEKNGTRTLYWRQIFGSCKLEKLVRLYADTRLHVDNNVYIWPIYCFGSLEAVWTL